MKFVLPDPEGPITTTIFFSISSMADEAILAGESCALKSVVAAAADISLADMLLYLVPLKHFLDIGFQLHRRLHRQSAQ